MVETTIRWALAFGFVAAEYEAEAMFAGWVDFPPLFRSLLQSQQNPEASF